MAIEDRITFLTCNDNGLQFSLKNMPIPRVGEMMCIQSKHKRLEGLYKVENIYYHIQEGKPKRSVKLLGSDKFTHVVVELSYKK